ncbi:MAG: MlaD family protein, partial [Planctomycetota bacterium]
MSFKASEVRSGIFVVLATGVLGVLVFSVGNFRARFQPSARYHAFLSDAKFLKAHDAVTYAGLRVGEVKRVDVAPERFGTVRVTIEVDPGIPVREDSVLVLKQDGMLGPKYLEILPGNPAAPPPPPRAPTGAPLPPPPNAPTPP